MAVLALDLGSTTGYAWRSNGCVISGTWDFSKTSRFEGGGIRYLRFREQLDAFHALNKISVVYFEEVRGHKGVDAAHVYGGLLATLTSWCEERNIAYAGAPVGTIKKFWTGKGNANKEAMIEQARRLGYDPVDDNEADALAILHLKDPAKTPCAFPDCACDLEGNGKHQCPR